MALATEVSVNTAFGVERVVRDAFARAAARPRKKLTLVPILRAGLGMVEGILRLVPAARVGHVGLYRNHETLEPVDYYFKVPGDAAERDFFVLDPMLATGGSAASAVTSLKRAGAQRVRFLCLVAAPEGVRRLPTGEERWFYRAPAPGHGPVTFSLRPKPSTFAPDYYELVRRPEYEALWYAAVEQWRTGTTAPTAR